MKHDIAFLHTSPIHVPTFEKLMLEVAPALKASHHVREDLLADAQREGTEGAPLIARIQEAMRVAGASGAEVVVCTCSTIGGVAEATEGATFKAARIDRAMADKAVSDGRPVLMVAALESTLEPTMTLLQASAKRLGTNPRIDKLVVQGAWDHFLSGEKQKYIDAIVSAVSSADASSSIVVLAQASMAPAESALGKLGITALSSPRLGVEHAITLCTG